MSMRSFRRGLFILLIDLAIIIGIFVLQFRTDSTIIEKIGGLQVTLEKVENPETDVILQNKLVVSYNGLNFFSDDQNSAKIIPTGKSKPQNIILKDWKIKDGQGFSFIFTNDVQIDFDVSGTQDDATLSVSTNYPSSVEQIMLPYSFSYNMKVQKDEGNKVVLNGKKSACSFTTNQVKDGLIYFTSKDAMAHYAVYDDTKKFSFDSITSLAMADEAMYQRTIDTFKNNLIASFKNALAENNFTELSAVAYVAAMSEKGRYQQALEEFPSAYKRSDSRTYVSAPYFNNLSKMNTTLESEIKKNNAEIDAAIASLDTSILTKRNIAAQLIIYNKPESVKTLLEAASAMDMELATLEQTCALVKAYVEFVQYKSDFASVLAPAMEKCMDRFTLACDFENDILTLKENDQFLSVNSGVDIGESILRYGMVTNQVTYIKAGRVIVNSYLSEGLSFDIRTLTTLYPILAYDNWYYPHYVFLKNGSDLMWAWTCAQSITATEDEETGLSLDINFPEGQIHHVLFKGIPKFGTIYIYNIAYRTDPRFETYNSSGYVYKDEGNTLLLKSRHKSKNEIVRMTKKK